MQIQLSPGTESTTMNETYQTLLNYDMEILILNLLVFIIVLFGLAGNLIVFYHLVCRKWRNPLMVYMLNLTGADVLFLCCHIVYFLCILISFFKSTSTFISCIFNVMFFLYIGHLSILGAISAEHCLSVLCPIWYCSQWPKHTSLAICTMLWSLSLLLSFLEGECYSPLFSCFKHGWCRAFDIITAVWLIFSFVVLLMSNLVLVFRMLCSSWQIQLTRFSMVILISVLIFLLCGLPLGIQWSLGVWIRNNYYMSSYFLKKTMDILPSVNSSAKPIIYFFIGSFSQQQQQQQQMPTLMLFLHRALEDIPKGGENLSQETMEMSKVVSCSDSALVSVCTQLEQ